MGCVVKCAVKSTSTYGQVCYLPGVLAIELLVVGTDTELKEVLTADL